MNRKAYTLIELLVIAAIIGIFAAVLGPVFVNSRREATIATSAEHLKQVALAEIMYQSDYDDDFVISSNDQCDLGCPATEYDSCPGGSLTTPKDWNLCLLPYVKNLQ